MTSLIPLPVALPMIVAAGLVALSPLLHRRLVDTVAILTAGASLVLCLLLLYSSLAGTAVYWFGDWLPRNGQAVGICFVIDPASAGLASLAALLVLCALVFSWRYFDAVGTLYHALMMIFLAAMVGFCLTGDVFNLFVFFELMSVVAYALTGYKIEEESALEGAINFGVTNTVGGFFVLLGIGLLYGRAGALNMAQIGRELSPHPADGLVICALTFIAGGFLVKAAVVPFHFWLSDAHAVAPTPVCVLFSGVMVELGFYAVFRVYWEMFSGVAGIGVAFGHLMLGVGIVTAMVGAVMCLLQRHLKRLLAFSTISHMGVFVIGASLLNPSGLAGTFVYLLGHGLVKGALFICAGIVLHQSGSLDEIELLPRRVGSPLLICVYTAAALGLAGLPPFATCFGKSMIEDSVHGTASTALAAVMIFSSAVTAGAVLRAGGRIFFGLGWLGGEERKGPTDKPEPETREGRRWIPSVMIGPAFALTVLAILAGFTPHLEQHAAAAAMRMENRPMYAQAVLDGRGAMVAPPPVHKSSISSGLISAGLAIALALFELFGGRISEPIREMANPVVDGLRAIHSGQIGDYVTWLIIGVTAFGLTIALSLV